MTTCVRLRLPARRCWNSVKAHTKPGQNSQTGIVRHWKKFPSIRPTRGGQTFLTPRNASQTCWYGNGPLVLNRKFASRTLLKTSPSEELRNAEHLAKCGRDCAKRHTRGDFLAHFKKVLAAGAPPRA